MTAVFESRRMSLTAALILDAIFGEPDWLWRRLPHPAVLLGRLVGALDRRLNRGGWRRAKGALALAALVAAALAIGWSIAILPLSPLPEIVAAAILLAQRSLADHVSAVADGLDMGVAEGRAAVAHIVGRDTAAMDEPAVARAAIDAGADMFVTHGIHALAGVEIYKGRPIFYGLSNFTFQFGLQVGASYDAFANFARKSELEHPACHEAILAVCEWDNGALQAVKLHPADLGGARRPLSQMGIPLVPEPKVATRILTDVQSYSEPFGTRIEIIDGVGWIRT